MESGAIPDYSYMKTFFKTVALTITVIMLLAACGNAGAQNDRKNKAQKGVQELNAESFSEKVFDMNSEELAETLMALGF